MRIRTVKPEFWRSDDITALSREHRLLYIGLWSYVDDNGVGLDDYRQIAADLFALEDDQKEVRDYVRDGVETLSRALLITRYEVDGKGYLYVNKWDKHQRVDRPNKTRHPRPLSEPDPPAREDSSEAESQEKSARDPRESPSTGTGEQGNRGKEQLALATLTDLDSRRPDPLERFAEFYAVYPRRRDRRAAEKAWTAAVKRKVEPQRMIDAAGSYAKSQRGTEAKYVKLPATWLNKGSYDDEPDAQLCGGTFTDACGNIVSRRA